jgi:uncharacterized protein YjdB
MSPLRGLIAFHSRTLRSIIITAALLACGDSSNPVAPGGGGGVASIAITPNAPTVTVGGQLALQAEAKNGSGSPISSAAVFWSSDDTSTVRVSSSGVVTGRALGTAQVAASSGGVSAKVVVTVVSVPVASLVVAPGAATLIVGGTTILQAVTSSADGTVLAGRTIVWASSSPQVAAVDATGNVIGVSAGSATITATCEGKTASSTITITVIPIASIAMTPGSATLVVGQSTSLTPIATDANGNVLGGRPMTWKSADTTIATVSDLGLVTAVGAGTVAISATAEGKTGMSQIVVTPATPTPVASVTLTPTSASLVVGSAATISDTLKDASGHVLTGRAVAWVSNTPGVATVDASGVVTAVSAGTATITATSEGKTASATITVSLVPVASVVVSPTSANLYVGGTTTISAIAKDANGNALAGRVVEWTSSAPTIATVNSATGLVTAIAPGTATITATSETKSADASVVVTLVPVGSVSINQSALNMVTDSSITLTATVRDDDGHVLTGRPVTWHIDVNKVATLGLTSGVLTTTDTTGIATITATSADKSDNVHLTVGPAPVGTVTLNLLSVGLQVPTATTITATVKDSHGKTVTGRTITWTSSDPTVASVASSGAASADVTPLTQGATTLTATSEGKSGTMTVTVTDPIATVLVTPLAPTVVVYGTVQLADTTKNAGGTVLTGRTVTWASGTPTIATVDHITGLVTGVAAGTATITATSAIEGIPGNVIVTVSAAPVATVIVVTATPNIQVGATAQFTDTTKDSHGAVLTGRSVTWSSNNPSVATVDATTGVATAVAAGSANIIATSSDGPTGSAALTVTNAPVASVTVAPTAPTLSLTGTTTVTMTATPMDAASNPLSGRTVTWSSDNPAVATVDLNTGVVTAVSQGTANIIATCETVPGTTIVTVLP